LITVPELRRVRRRRYGTTKLSYFFRTDRLANIPVLDNLASITLYADLSRPSFLVFLSQIASYFDTCRLLCAEPRMHAAAAREELKT
jgi:hypothetical protein